MVMTIMPVVELYDASVMSFERFSATVVPTLSFRSLTVLSISTVPEKVETPVALKSPVVVPPETNMPSFVVSTRFSPLKCRSTEPFCVNKAIVALLSMS